MKMEFAAITNMKKKEKEIEVRTSGRAEDNVHCGGHTSTHEGDPRE